jgi:hypothetical protein
MGVELTRAQIAWQVGKRYVQDEDLKWGCAYKNKTPRPHAEKLHAYKAEGSTLQAKKRKSGDEE